MKKLLFAFVLVLMFSLTGCKTVLYNQDLTTTKLEEKVTQIEKSFKLIPADDPTQEGYQPWIFEGREITTWFYKQMSASGSKPQFSPWVDSKYFVLDYDNAVESMKLFSKYIWKFRFKNSSRDCDDYAFAYRSWIQFLFADTYDLEAAASVAVIFVEQKHDFANVPGGDGAHALIGVGTDKGPVIMEPQNGINALLEDYPNKAHIYYIIR